MDLRKNFLVMQKKFFLVAIYFTLTGVCVYAQNKKHIPAPPVPPVPPVGHLIAPSIPPPPPPPPPLPLLCPESSIPTIPSVAPIAPVKEINEIIFKAVESASDVIVNSNGYEASVQKRTKEAMIIVEKDNVVKRIKLSTWNAKRKYYEKKYGHLPPTANIGIGVA
jgi:hypothetical protein